MYVYLRPCQRITIESDYGEEEEVSLSIEKENIDRSI